MAKKRIIDSDFKELEKMIEENFDNPKVIQLLERGIRLYKRKSEREKKDAMVDKRER